MVCRSCLQYISIAWCISSPAHLGSMGGSGGRIWPGKLHNCPRWLLVPRARWRRERWIDRHGLYGWNTVWATSTPSANSLGRPSSDLGEAICAYVTRAALTTRPTRAWLAPGPSTPSSLPVGSSLHLRVARSLALLIVLCRIRVHFEHRTMVVSKTQSGQFISPSCLLMVSSSAPCIMSDQPRLL